MPICASGYDAAEGSIRQFSHGWSRVPRNGTPTTAISLSLTRVIDRDRADWRKRDDSLWRFLDEELEFNPEAHVMSTDLFHAFNLWQATQNQRAWGEKMFSDRLTNHELTAEHGVYRQRTRRARGSGLSRPTGVVASP